MIRALAVAVCLALVGAAGLAEPIQRNRAEVRAFRADNPCPATDQVKGACPDWHVDHIIPLCAGGLDHRSNMQWISRDDHRWKTRWDIRECRKLERAANRPATE